MTPERVFCIHCGREQTHRVCALCFDRGCNPGAGGVLPSAGVMRERAILWWWSDAPFHARVDRIVQLAIIAGLVGHTEVEVTEAQTMVAFSLAVGDALLAPGPDS